MREDRAAHRGDEVADHLLGFDHAERVPGAEVDADGGQLHLRDVRQLVRGLARNAQSQASLLGPAPPEAVGELKTRILEVHVPSLYRQKGGYGTTYPPWRPLRVPRRPDALAPADRGLSARGGGDRNRRRARQALDHLLALLRVFDPELVEVEGALGDPVGRNRRVPTVERVKEMVLRRPVLAGVPNRRDREERVLHFAGPRAAFAQHSAVEIHVIRVP